MSERIVVYAIDLMDRSKVSAAAGEAGLDVSFVRSAAALVERVAGGASTVVVDLGRARRHRRDPSGAGLGLGVRRRVRRPCRHRPPPGMPATPGRRRCSPGARSSPIRLDGWEAEPWLDDCSSSGGTRPACRLLRRPAARDPELEIVALERGKYTSYSACGIPYVVGGVVDDLDDLVVRTPEQFREDTIDVHVRHEVTGIDLDAGGWKRFDHTGNGAVSFGFDQLMVASGPGPGGPIFRAWACRSCGASRRSTTAPPCSISSRPTGAATSWSLAVATSVWRWPRRSCSGAPGSCSSTPPTT